MYCKNEDYCINKRSFSQLEMVQFNMLKFKCTQGYKKKCQGEIYSYSQYVD